MVKMDKTQELTLKQKIQGKWDFDETEFQNQKLENYGFKLESNVFYWSQQVGSSALK